MIVAMDISAGRGAQPQQLGQVLEEEVPHVLTPTVPHGLLGTLGHSGVLWGTLGYFVGTNGAHAVSCGLPTDIRGLHAVPDQHVSLYQFPSWL